MSRIWNTEWINSFILALVLLGIILILIGGYQFVDASLRIESNPVHQLRQSGQQPDVQSQAEVRGLVAADVERRGLIKQRSYGLVYAGGGLALASLGWLGHNLVTSRRRKQHPADTLSTAGQ